MSTVLGLKNIQYTQGFFTKFLVGGLAFEDDFRSPLGMESYGGEGGLASGMESDEGGFGKLSPEVKNAPYCKIRANFCILSIKYSFLMLF